MNQTGEDRRKSSRVWLPLEVSYTVVDKSDKKTLVTKDISGGGLKLTLDEKRKSPQCGFLDIIMPDMDGRTVLKKSGNSTPPCR